MNIGERLGEVITPKIAFSFSLFGYRFDVADAIVLMWAVTIVLIGLAFLLTRKLAIIPGKRQAGLEMFVGAVNNMGEQWLGHYAPIFTPWFGSIFLFLIASNVLALFNFIPGVEITPPTKNINITGSMAIISILMVIFSGLILKGPRHFLKTFVTPSPIMLPFKIMDYGTKPLSLALRLFGNIFGAFVIMELLYLVVPLFVPAVFSVYFDLFDGAIQAFIFSYLSMIYIAEVLE